MIRVLVVAAAAIMRAGLEALVAATPDLAVAGRSAGGPSLADEIAALRPQVVLSELEWRPTDPLPALPPIGAAPGDPAVVILADDLRGAWVAEALRAGALAILPRDASAEAIVAAIRAAALGLVTLPQAVAADLVPLLAAARAAPTSGTHQTLTAREIEVLGMLAEGIGNKIIARRLGISEHTVKFHVASIMAKFNAGSRTEAVAIGARQGLVVL